MALAAFSVALHLPESAHGVGCVAVTSPCERVATLDALPQAMFYKFVCGTGITRTGDPPGWDEPLGREFCAPVPDLAHTPGTRQVVKTESVEADSAEALVFGLFVADVPERHGDHHSESVCCSLDVRSGCCRGGCRYDALRLDIIDLFSPTFEQRRV
jgi:hypothetical protein